MYDKFYSHVLFNIITDDKNRNLRNSVIYATGYAPEPEAIPEWPHREAGDREAEVGDGIQGIPGVD